MSEQQSTASMLDGLLLGEPISSHHGVRCCPAIGKTDDDRYMVKIISIPAGSGQLEALLLSGACADADQAQSYFKEVADGVAAEAAIVRRLGNLEGFEPHLSYEVQEMDNTVGYEVRLLSRYHKTLANLMKKEPLTHLAAVNLGLDLCAALTACRRLGYIYVDLKPENIFFTENHGYRIGDLGFLSLASLPYASLPEKYRSRYTAPEVGDAMSSLNSTMDIYALGLILYQVYNNSQFPFEGSAPAKALPTPMYADYEMADIIAKACAPDPSDRWQDPAQMGQALVDYMQRNVVNATPIIPPLVLTAPAEEFNESFLTEEENDAQLADLLSALPEEIDPEQLAMDGSTQSLETTDIVEPLEHDEAVPKEADEDQLSFLDDLKDDETLPDAEAFTEVESGEVSEEVALMLAQADDLISHELPEPVVAPGPIDVAMPPIVTEEPQQPEPEEEPIEPISENTNDEDAEKTVPYDTEDAYIYDLPPKRRTGRWIALITAVLLLLACAVGGYIWYQEMYIQIIDALTVQGQGSEMTVTLITEAEESLLSVICTDTYGNTIRSNVVGGTATFTNLTPSTQYRIRVEISGLHKLTGSINGIYTTDSQTEILNLTAVHGTEDGSAILNFSVNGPDSTAWIVHISSAGEKERTLEFFGHSTTVYSLSPGTEYTFRLEAVDDLPLGGQTEITFTARKLITPTDLKVTDWGGGSLSIQWSYSDAPAGQLWLIRCYNSAGFDQTVTTSDTSYIFTGLDQSSDYTILVSAEGMPTSASTAVTANPIHVLGYTATAPTTYALSVEWEFTGEAPTNGWVLTYTLNGQEFSIPCPDNRTLLALVPGAAYEFTAHPADAITCFTQSGSFTAEEAVKFEGFGIAAENINAQLVVRPEGLNWGFADLNDDSYKTEFSEGENAAIILTAGTNFVLSNEAVNIVFAIRDEAAQLISAEQVNVAWNTMWSGIHCPLNLADLPGAPGRYTMDLYFNNLLVATLVFSIR